MDPVSKTGVPFFSGPRVRIPPSPLYAALLLSLRCERRAYSFIAFESVEGGVILILTVLAS